MLLLNQKVDKVDGKGLSTHDYDDAARDLLHTLSNELNNKVDKVEGKGLSTCDFSNAYKNKLDGIENGAQANVIEEIRLFNVPLTITGKAVNLDLSDYYYSKIETDSFLSGKEDKSNKVTSISSQSTDTEYPSAKATHDAIRQALSNVYKFQGTMTVSQLNALVKDASMHGFVYNVADDGNLNVLIGGSVASVPVVAGDNVALVYTNENNINWDKLAGTFTVDLSNYVDLTSEQTISGKKTFTNLYANEINAQSTFIVKFNGAGMFALTPWNILPYRHQDFGSSSYPIKDIYFDGKLKDGTHEWDFNSIGFPIISKPASTTLTAAEMAAIQKGCQIDGTFLNLIKPTFYPARTGIAGVLSRGMYIGYAPSGNQETGTYEINEITRVIQLSTPTQDFIDYNNVGKINKKQIPPYPTSNEKPQIPTIAPNGGVLSWSDMPTVPQAEPIDIEILEMKIIQDDMAFDENAPASRCRYDYVDDSRGNGRNDPKFAYLHIKSSFIDDYAEQQIREGNFIIRFDYPTFYQARSRKMKGNGRYSFVKNLYMGNGGSYLGDAEDIERSFLYINQTDIKTDGRGRKFIYKKIPIVDVLNRLWKFNDYGEVSEATDDYFDYDKGFLDQVRVGGAVQTHENTFLGGGPSRKRDSGTVKYGYTDFSYRLHSGELSHYGPAHQSPNKDAMLLHYWAPFMIFHETEFSTIFARQKYLRAQLRNDNMNGGMTRMLKFASEAVVKPRFAILDPDYDVVEGNDSMWVKKYPQYKKRLYCYPAQLFDTLISNEDGDFDVVIFRFGISK